MSPELHAAGYRDVRSAHKCDGFPTLLYYRIERQTVVVLAIQFGGAETRSVGGREYE